MDKIKVVDLQPGTFKLPMEINNRIALIESNKEGRAERTEEEEGKQAEGRGGEDEIMDRKQEKIKPLTSSELLFHGDVGAFDLPLVRFGAEGEHFGLVALRRRIKQLGDQTIRIGRMVMHQFGQRPKTAL